MTIFEIGKNLEAIVMACQIKELRGFRYDSTKGKSMLKELLDSQTSNEAKIDFLSCLMHWITKDYDLVMKSTGALQEGKIYIENDGNSFEYKVINSIGTVQTGKIAKTVLGLSETEEVSKVNLFFLLKSEDFLLKILKATEKTGHTIVKTLNPSKEESTFKKIIAYSCAKDILLDLQQQGEYSVPNMFFTNEGICNDLKRNSQDFPNLKHLLAHPLLLKGIATMNNDEKEDNRFSKINLLDNDAVDKFCSAAEEYEKKKLNEKDLSVINKDEKNTPKMGEVEIESKPSIVIKVFNCKDGIGDFTMFKKIAEKIKSHVGYAYDVIGILEIDQLDDSSNISKTIASDLKDANPFDLLYIFDRNIDEKKIVLQENKDNKIKIDWSSSEIKDDLTYVYNLRENAALKLKKTAKVYVNLVYGGMGETTTLVDDMGPGTITLTCAELGQSPKGVYRRDNTTKLRADTGLPYSDESYIHGLLIDTYPKLDDNDKLSTEKQFKNQEYITKLLGGSSIGDYSKSHVFKLGYLQSTLSGTAFILSNILTHMSNENVLEKKIDFHLNNAAIDKVEIKTALKILGIEDKDIEFISSDDLQESDVTAQTMNEKRIRIFCGCRLETKDYALMYSLCSLCNKGNGIAGVSGDNTFTECVSSGCIPFAMGAKEGNQFFRDFLSNQLKDFLKYNNFNLLNSYFEKQITLLHHSKTANSDFLTLCKDIAEDLKSEELKSEWKICCSLIKQKYNYYNKLPAIIDNALQATSSQIEMISNMSEILKHSITDLSSDVGALPV